jgi:hypothetical protein
MSLGLAPRAFFPPSPLKLFMDKVSAGSWQTLLWVGVDNKRRTGVVILPLCLSLLLSQYPGSVGTCWGEGRT